jgi:threonine/homoserine/homoserine lactone efflux protein
VLEVLVLLSLGFAVGLSGAVIPGPLLAFTVLDTSRKHRVTGHSIILGHALWELVVILVILLGFGWIVSQNKLLIYVVGGFVLAFMGAIMLGKNGGETRMESARVNSSFGGGVFYTIFNPTQPAWWATAGLALLVKGMEIMGLVGIVIVTLGHWLSDFAYYLFVSYMSIILGVFMISLGIYFAVQGLLDLR